MERYRDPVELSRFSVQEIDGARELSWRTESEENNAGFTLYRGSAPDDLQPLASWQTDPEFIGNGSLTNPYEYRYMDDSDYSANPVYYRLAWHSTTGIETPIDWVIKTLTASAVSILINEIQADNAATCPDESGDYDDWIELYNAGTEPVNLGGMYLTDDLTEPDKWILPPVTIDPATYLVFWCDGEIDEGALHTNFKLDADGESIGLFSNLADGNLPVDTVTFDRMDTDQSLGRLPDGGNSWRTDLSPTPGRRNK